MKNKQNYPLTWEMTRIIYALRIVTHVAIDNRVDRFIYNLYNGVGAVIRDKRQ